MEKMFPFYINIIYEGLKSDDIYNDFQLQKKVEKK